MMLTANRSDDQWKLSGTLVLFAAFFIVDNASDYLPRVI